MSIEGQSGSGDRQSRYAETLSARENLLQILLDRCPSGTVGYVAMADARRELPDPVDDDILLRAIDLMKSLGLIETDADMDTVGTVDVSARLTPLGIAEAERLLSRPVGRVTRVRGASIFDIPQPADEAQRQVLQTIWDLLVDGGEWPSVDDVDGRLAGTVNTYAVLQKMPTDLATGNWVPGGAQPTPDHLVYLTMAGVAACTGTDLDVELFLTSIDLAVQSSERDRTNAVLTSGSINAAASAPVAPERLARLAKLLDREPWGGTPVVLDADGAWVAQVSPGAREYKNLRDLAEYWNRRPAQHEFASRNNTPLPSASPTDQLDLEQGAVAVNPPTGPDPTGVFVIHGRNNAARSGLFQFLRSIGLKPLEWSKAIAQTGKGSPYIGEVLDAAFGSAQAIIVLQTPDDVAYLHPSLTDDVDDPETQAQMQPRPNVLFEAGMAMGRDPDRTVIVELGQVKVFSDIHGRHVVRLDNSTGKRQDLAERLRTAGCTVDLTGRDWHTEGDLTPPSPPGGGLPLGRKLPTVKVAGSPRVDAKHIEHGGNTLGEIEIINHGPGDLFDMAVTTPEQPGLTMYSSVEFPVPKLPAGKSLRVMRISSHTGGPTYINVTVTGKSVDGEPIEAEIFVSGV